MEENIRLYDLLNLSIGTPQRGSVNFSALHALLQALLKQLDIREVTTRWTHTPPGDGASETPLDVPVEVLMEPSWSDPLVQPGSELQNQTDPVSAPDGTGGLQSRIQTCEDGVSQVLKLIEELQKNQLDLKEKTQELQQAAVQQLETVTDVEQCCHRVDALEKAVNSLEETIQRYPGPEKLSQCVTRDFVQSVPKEVMSEKERVASEVPERPVLVEPTGPPHTAPSSSPLHNESSTPPAVPPSPHISAEDLTSEAAETTEVSCDGSDGGITEPEPGEAAPSIPQLADDLCPTSGSTPADWTSSVPPGSLPQTSDGPTRTSAPPPADVVQTQEASGPVRYQETVEAVRNIRSLQERLSQLEEQMLVLEDQKVDRSELALLRQPNTYRASQDASIKLTEQLQQHRALIENLMSDHEKLENLEDMMMSLMSQETGSSSGGASDSLDPDSKALSQQVFYLRKSVTKVEEEVKHLKVQQALCEERAADQHLQGQLDDLRSMLEDMILSLTSRLSSSLQEEEEEDLSESSWRSALTSSSVKVGRKLSLLFQHYEQLQDSVNLLLQQQQGGGRAEQVEDRELSRNMELVHDVQRAILQLQAECEGLQETTRNLHEDNRQKQGHIEELYRTAENLQLKKADKQMVESKINADNSALESKVSRLQFDLATEQLNSMFHELLSKVTGQEQDWHKVIDRLSTEMECKLNRIELDSVKMQLEDRWRSIHKKLQAQSAPEQEDAAGIRKQLVERFHCLSCDRPIMKQTPGPILVTLPSFPAFPQPKSIRPWTLEQIRQHYRSLTPGTDHRRAQLQKNHADMCRQIESIETQRRLRQNPAGGQHDRVSEAPVRSCGGNLTNVSPGQRRSGPQNPKLLSRAEVDDLMQEADIVGRDGQIYRGRFSVHQLKNPETKLPTIGKMKEKSQRPAVSPEVEPNALLHPQTLSARTVQSSRPASSGSGRDWPVSALGCCTSQSSESVADPERCEPLNL